MHPLLRYDERKLLIICGILPMILARALTLPWPGGPDIQMAEEETTTTTLAPMVRNVDCGDDGDPLGCSKDWCEDQPGLYEAQFFTAFFINFVAYPFCIAISQSLFSTALGPRPQGVWMGILTSAGSSARVLGPIMVSYIYDEYGVYLTFGLIIISM